MSDDLAACNSLSEIIQSVQKLGCKPTFLDIVGKQFSETLHSSFLGWIFANDDFLHLSSSPITCLLNMLLNKGTAEQKCLIKESDIKEVYTTTEKTITRGRIDLFIEVVLLDGRKIRIWLENKIFSKPGKGQLNRYYKSISKSRNSKKHENIFVFLSLSKKNAPDHGAFHHLTYQEIYDYILVPLKMEIERKNLPDSYRYLNEYIRTITHYDEYSAPLVKSKAYEEKLAQIYTLWKESKELNYCGIVQEAVNIYGTNQEKKLIEPLINFEISFQGEHKGVRGYTKLAVEVFRQLIKKNTAEELVSKVGRIPKSQLPNFDNRVCDTIDSKGASSGYSSATIGTPTLYISNQWCYLKTQLFIKLIESHFPEIKIESGINI